MQCLSKSSATICWELYQGLCYIILRLNLKTRDLNEIIYRFHIHAIFGSVHKILTSFILFVIAENKCKTSTFLNVCVWIAFPVQITATVCDCSLYYRLHHIAVFLLASKLTVKHMHAHNLCGGFCAWTHTCFALRRWKLGVGTRRLMETGHTRLEYWWDAARMSLMQKSDTHAHIHNLHLCDPCHDLLSLAFITNTLWHEVHCVIWMPTKLRMLRVVVSHTEIAGKTVLLPLIHHSIIELSTLRSCWMCFEWGW